MFANLKKKIESEVGDLSRLNPSTVLSRNTSTPLSSRHDSISSLASESSTPIPEHSSSLLSPLPGSSSAPSSSITPNRNNMSLHALKLKGLEEKLQAQESDFAWRLSNKDDEILNLNKTIEILTGQLKSKDSEVQKKLVRVQEDIDTLEGFSQQENAKLKHLLLNKEEELSSLKANVMIKEREVLELGQRVRSLEGENARVLAQFEKVQSRVGGEEVDSGRVKELEHVIEGCRKREQDLSAELEGLKNQLREVSRVSESKELEFQRKVESLTVENAKLNVKLNSVSSENESLRRSVETANVEKSNFGGRLDELKEQNAVASARIEELKSENGKVCERVRALGDEKTAWEGRINDLSEQNALYLSQVQKLKAQDVQVAELSEEKRVLLSQIEGLKRSVEEVEKSKLELQVTLRETGDAQSAALQAQVERLERENFTLSEKINSLQAENARVCGELQLSGNDSVRVLELGKLNEELESRVRNANLQLAEMGMELETARTEHEGLRAQLTGKVSELEKTSREAAQKYQQQIQAVKHKCEGLQAKVGGLEDENFSLKENQSFLANENEALRAEKERLSDQLNSLGGESDSRVRELQGLLEKEKRETGHHVGELSTVNEELNRKVRVLEADALQTASVLKDMKSAIGDSERKIVELSDREKRALESVRELQAAAEDYLSLQRRIHEFEAVLREKDEAVVSLRTREAGVLEKLDDLQASFETNNNVMQGRVDELERSVREKDCVISELRKSEVESRVEELESDLQVKDVLISELDSEKSELLVQVSELQSRVDMLEEENKFQDHSQRVGELERALEEKKQQLRQQAHTLSDLRRSLAKELKASKPEEREPVQEPAIVPSTAYVNGTASQVHEDSSMSVVTDVASLPRYETDVNFMYLRSVLFKYLTSSDPQITSHLTRVVATLLHLTEEETQTLVNAVEARSNQHLLAHIIK